MELQDHQKQMVRAWAAEGASLSEIQKRLSGEFGITMTFMDVRFLVLDLGAEIVDKNARSEKSEAKPAAQEFEPEDDVAGGVRVDIDRVVKPGALVSGTAVFGDGVQATWALDQMGRLALQGPNPEYRPSPEDVQAFQQALQQELAKRGF
jgi:hypothetical protein